ncbi:hypothetical protein L596_017685 [Steinernema carpocapsae]|uniref:Uncharacterized protein n=1 Tax=Steinernema carpocapsae TaxID=34508 RepID=A0A4U5N2E8_STECR|nr:hypothetical protein L596_017685 [Steinernema carpocapsae]
MARLTLLLAFVLLFVAVSTYKGRYGRSVRYPPNPYEPVYYPGYKNEGFYQPEMEKSFDHAANDQYKKSDYVSCEGILCM